MSCRTSIRFAAPAVASALLLLTPAMAQAQGPSVAVNESTLTDPFGPRSYIYAPGWYGPEGVLSFPDLYGSRYPGSLWYWSNVSWPSRSWYSSYNAGPGGYRVFYPRGNGDSYYQSQRTGIIPWSKVEPVPDENAGGWQFPRDASRKRQAR